MSESNSDVSAFKVDSSSEDGKKPFSYVKNDVDLTDHALDFVDFESDYYKDMKSYTTEKDLELFLCVGGVVSSSGVFDLSGNFTEKFRENKLKEEVFDSIYAWVNSYYGEVVTYDKMFNNVFIGEDLVPLWRVLEVSYEEMEEDLNNSIDDTIEKNQTTFMIYLSLLVLLVGLLGCYAIIFTVLMAEL